MPQNAWTATVQFGEMLHEVAQSGALSLREG